MCHEVEAPPTPEQRREFVEHTINDFLCQLTGQSALLVTTEAKQRIAAVLGSVAEQLGVMTADDFYPPHKFSLMAIHEVVKNHHIMYSIRNASTAMVTRDDLDMPKQALVIYDQNGERVSIVCGDEDGLYGNDIGILDVLTGLQLTVNSRAGLENVLECCVFTNRMKKEDLPNLTNEQLGIRFDQLYSLKARAESLTQHAPLLSLAGLPRAYKLMLLEQLSRDMGILVE